MQKKLPKEIHVIQFMVLMCFSSISVLNLLPLYLEKLGATPGQIGFIIGLFPFASFLARPFGGWLLNKIDPRWGLISGLFLQFVMTLFYLFVNDIGGLVIVIRIFQGFGVSIFILAALLITVNLTESHQRVYALGVVSSGFVLPLLLLPFLGERIIVNRGFTLFFWLAIILAFVPFVLSSLLRFPRQELEEAAAKPAGFLTLLFRKKILIILLLSLLFEVALSASFSFVPLLAHKQSSMLAGFYYTFLAVMAVFLRLYAGRRFRFWGRPGMVIPAFLFLAVGSVSLYLSRTNVHLILTGLIWGTGVGILYPHLSAIVMDGTSSLDRSRVLGIFSAFVDLGFALGPLLFGLLSQGVGVRQSFCVFAGGLLLIPLVLVGVGRKEIF